MQRDSLSKAMEIASRQLIARTVSSVTPSSPLAMFGGIGEMKNNFEIPLYLLFLMAAIITAVNLDIGVLLCRPIKCIAAYSLIKE